MRMGIAHVLKHSPSDGFHLVACRLANVSSRAKCHAVTCVLVISNPVERNWVECFFYKLYIIPEASCEVVSREGNARLTAK